MNYCSAAAAAALPLVGSSTSHRRLRVSRRLHLTNMLSPVEDDRYNGPYVRAGSHTADVRQSALVGRIAVGQYI